LTGQKFGYHLMLGKSIKKRALTMQSLDYPKSITTENNYVREINYL